MNTTNNKSKLKKNIIRERDKMFIMKQLFIGKRTNLQLLLMLLLLLLF